ncbi:MAG TPA: cbb3-type cytochrome c oxidase N-terminal domain-containing protein [Bacteroidia bacterium]|nr:cbb3-type cytochrome c oxidase N-terminal domain-containing protein [Bacteroidia bacterium]
MKYTTKTKWLGLLIISPLAGFAQDNAGGSYFSNALFNTLFVIILMLLILVIALSNSIRNIIQSDFFKERIRKMKEHSGSTKAGLFLAFFFLSAYALNAQTAAPVPDSRVGGIDPFTFYFMIGIIFIELIAVIMLFNVLRIYTRDEMNAAPAPESKPVEAKYERTILDVFNASVDVDKEAEIMLDHDYDGIKELDNNLPPWWKYGFYFTVICAVIYLINFHVAGTGDLQTSEYNKEIAAAKLQVEEYMHSSAGNVDESTVKLLSDAAALEAGKKTFQTNCIACHGKAGEGNTVGPNLTDNYWLHEGSINAIFKTIKYGWPDKGMKSWKEDLSPLQIAQVASFIKSLAGSNPPNAKAPQGDLYSDSPVAKADSAQKTAPVPTDSLNKKP